MPIGLPSLVRSPLWTRLHSSTRRVRFSLRASALRLCMLAVPALLTSCGGGGDPAAPGAPTLPVNNAPSSLSIVAGDAQQGLPGAVLANSLSVLVRSSSGAPLAGVSVQFAVDSGGGSIAGANAITNANGVATSGTWTLGAPGRNVASARSGSLPAVFFHSIAAGPAVRTLIDHSVLPTSGGVLRYRKSGDALDGLAITVPAGSYPSATTWTITADSVTRPTLPAEFTQMGPTITIDNAVGYADSVITLSLPLALGDADVVAPFFFDPATSHLEPIPLVERSGGVVATATRHFSRDLLALPGADPGVSAARATLFGARASSAAFGAVKIVWVKTPKAQLVGTYTSGFQAGTDNWEFENRGHFASPLGSCEGMSLTALHYWYYVRKNGGAPLYHGFDKVLSDQLDNVQGARYASAVQHDYDVLFDKSGSQIERLAEQAKSRGTKLEDLTSNWILLTIKMLKQPVLLTLRSSTSAHAVIATGASFDAATSATVVTFADPNFPKQSRTMRFEGSTVVPVPLSTNAKNPQTLYDKVYAVAVTAELPLTDISRRWLEFKNKQAGANVYPANYRLEYYSELTEAWERLPDTLRTTSQEVAIRHICSSCKALTKGGAVGEQLVAIWDGNGETLLRAPGASTLLLEPGATTYYAEFIAYTDVEPSEMSQLDTKKFTMVFSPVEVIRPTADSYVHAPETWRIDVGALAGPGLKYTWTPNDGNAEVTTTIPEHTFTPKKPGQFSLAITVRDASGTIIARKTAFGSVRVHLELSPAAGVLTKDTPVTFALSARDYALASIPTVHFGWVFEGSAAGSDDGENVVGASYTRSFDRTGDVKVTVYAYTVGRDSIDVPIGKVVEQLYTVSDIPPTWKFTSFTLQVEKPGANPWSSNPDIGSTTHFTRPETLFSELQAGSKQGGLMYLARDTTFGTRGRAPTLKRRGLYLVDTDQPLTAASVALYLDVPPQGTTYISSGAPQVRANWFMNPVAPFRVADEAALDERYTETGTIAGGSIVGTIWNWQKSTFKGNGLTLWFPYETRQINVTFGATTATGTITIISRDFDHVTSEVLPRPETKRWTIRATFTAERVR